MACRSKRKRGKRRKSPQVTADPLQTIRALLPPPNKIFRLQEFINYYAPALELDAASIKYFSEANVLTSVVISPLENLVPAPHIQAPECREPVPSLVDDVVWTLVQRRGRLKRLGEDGRNVLSQGYVSPSIEGQSGIRSTAQMRPGVICNQSNENVSFCKSSRIFQQLHACAGDEIFRMILLHTRLFVPVEKDFHHPRGNFILICGPPLRSERGSTSSVTKSSTANSQELPARGDPKKKRRRTSPETEPRLRPNATVSRFSLFYSDAFIPKIGFPKSHPLNEATMTSEKLLGVITDLYNDRGVKRRKLWKRLRGDGASICQDILKRHATCDYHRTLDRYCCLPDFLKKHGLSGGKQDENFSARVTLPVVAQAYTPPEKVASFLAAALRKVFPDSLWGSEKNFDRVVESVRLFVSLRRLEKLSNKSLMHGIRVNQIMWLRGPRFQGLKISRTDHEATCILTLKVLRWVFRGFVIPLLRSSFYVTETEFSAKNVLYYRKPVWSVFRSISLGKLLEKQFTELNETEVGRRLCSQSMGFSQLRLVPKSTGVRPIAHLSRRQIVKFEEKNATQQQVPSAKRSNLDESMIQPANKKVKPTVAEKASLRFRQRQLATNTILSEVFDVLRYECGTREQSYGAGLEGLVQFYPRYCRFIMALKRRNGPGQPLHLHFASVDIKKCYDNINQKHLLNIAKRHILHDDYVIQLFSLLYANDVKGGIEKVSKKVVGPPEQYGLVHQGHNELAERCNNVIFDSRKCQLAQKARVIELLTEHLSSHLVVTSGRFGQRFLLQSSGIAQGSVLSMLLCNLYYGELEEIMLLRGNPQSPTVKDRLSDLSSDFMARLVDDFIFVSTAQSSAASFLQRMYEGKPNLGVQINAGKTVASSAVELEVKDDQGVTRSIQVPVMPQRACSTNKLFPWCGMLFDTSTGEVYVDYERFHGSKIRDNLTVDRDGSEGRHFVSRMESFVRPRCLPILFDCAFNTKETLVTNFYQMMLFAAVKTVEHLRCSGMLRSSSNIEFLLRCVDLLSSYATRQIKSSLKRYSPEFSHSKFMLGEGTTSWLCWYAFESVFSHLSDLGTLSNRIGIEVSKRTVDDSMRKITRRAFLQFQLSRMVDA